MLKHSILLSGDVFLSCNDLATVEYAADVDLPDGIFTHPAVMAAMDKIIEICLIQNVKLPDLLLDLRSLTPH